MLQQPLLSFLDCGWRMKLLQETRLDIIWISKKPKTTHKQKIKPQTIKKHPQLNISQVPINIKVHINQMFWQKYAKQTLTSPDPWEVPSPWWFGEEELLQIKNKKKGINRIVLSKILKHCWKITWNSPNNKYHCWKTS